MVEKLCGTMDTWDIFNLLGVMPQLHLFSEVIIL